MILLCSYFQETYRVGELHPHQVTARGLCLPSPPLLHHWMIVALLMAINGVNRQTMNVLIIMMFDDDDDGDNCGHNDGKLGVGNSALAH